MKAVSIPILWLSLLPLSSSGKFPDSNANLTSQFSKTLLLLKLYAQIITLMAGVGGTPSREKLVKHVSPPVSFQGCYMLQFPSGIVWPSTCSEVDFLFHPEFIIINRRVSLL